MLSYDNKKYFISEHKTIKTSKPLKANNSTSKPKKSLSKINNNINNSFHHYSNKNVSVTQLTSNISLKSEKDDKQKQNSSFLRQFITNNDEDGRDKNSLFFNFKPQINKKSCILDKKNHERNIQKILTRHSKN